MDQAQRAIAFAELHSPGEPLLLPNAWDVASAVAIAGAGPGKGTRLLRMTMLSAAGSVM